MNAITRAPSLIKRPFCLPSSSIHHYHGFLVFNHENNVVQLCDLMLIQLHHNRKKNFQHKKSAWCIQLQESIWYILHFSDTCWELIKVFYFNEKESFRKTNISGIVKNHISFCSNMTHLFSIKPLFIRTNNAWNILQSS